jgi:hypothetical protein
LVGRIWHVRQGFIGVHLTRVEWNGGNPEYARDERITCGDSAGGAVWFGAVTPQTVLVVGEGIETTLSAMELWGIEAGAAALGTKGLANLVLPGAARRVIIAADNNKPLKGRKLGIGLEAAREAKREWQGDDPDVEVEIRLPPEPKGKAEQCDWNDVLMEQSHG